MKVSTSMIYKCIYKTPNEFDDIVMESDGKFLTKLIFLNSSDSEKLSNDAEFKNLKIFSITKKWLDIYFNGDIPDFTPEYKFYNLSYFTMEVIEYIKKIPYGKTITYGDIASKIWKCLFGRDACSILHRLRGSIGCGITSLLHRGIGYR